MTNLHKQSTLNNLTLMNSEKKFRLLRVKNKEQTSNLALSDLCKQ